MHQKSDRAIWSEHDTTIITTPRTQAPTCSWWVDAKDRAEFNQRLMARLDQMRTARQAIYVNPATREWWL